MFKCSFLHVLTFQEQETPFLLKQKKNPLAPFFRSDDKYLKSPLSFETASFFFATLDPGRFQGTSLDDELPQEELDPEAPEVGPKLAFV